MPVPQGTLAARKQTPSVVWILHYGSTIQVCVVQGLELMVWGWRFWVRETLGVGEVGGIEGEGTAREVVARHCARRGLSKQMPRGREADKLWRAQEDVFRPLKDRGKA